MLGLTAMVLVWTGHTLTWGWLAERLPAGVLLVGVVLPATRILPRVRGRLLAAGVLVALAAFALR
ncbi:hypothetical protein GCM10009789_37580 [Kribbella sancticallisti]|uniref:Uncharacterized protein n=1 Tax=Kribbella sancticallisti TaxID=460087 RepID=A0ABN2DM62_9ACTN